MRVKEYVEQLVETIPCLKDFSGLRHPHIFKHIKYGAKHDIKVRHTYSEDHVIGFCHSFQWCIEVGYKNDPVQIMAIFAHEMQHFKDHISSGGKRVTAYKTFETYLEYQKWTEYNAVLEEVKVYEIFNYKPTYPPLIPRYDLYMSNQLTAESNFTHIQDSATGSSFYTKYFKAYNGYPADLDKYLIKIKDANYSFKNMIKKELVNV